MNRLPLQQTRSLRRPAGGNSAQRQKFHCHIAHAAQTKTRSVHSPVEAVCLKKFKAHESSLTALLVEEDGPDVKRFISAGMDKMLCTWTLDSTAASELDPEGSTLQCVRVEVSGGPVFSLQQGIKPKIVNPNTKQQKPIIYLGLAGKEVTAWHPDQLTFDDKVRMNGHTGYVRSLAASGKYLFSCGCNYLRQWDQAFAVPKEVSSTKLFKGDILAIACGDKRVFTAGADGVLRSWSIGKTGELAESAVREKAHDGRITSILVSGSLLYSAGYDGTIKAWDVTSLKLVMEVKAAHDGERIQALVLGPSSSPAAASNSSSSSTDPEPASASDVSSVARDGNSTSRVPDTQVIDRQNMVECLESVHVSAAMCPIVSASSSPSAVTILYSGGDDKLVRRWDARLLTPAGDALQIHSAAVKSLAVGERELLVSGDAAGEVAVWSV